MSIPSRLVLSGSFTPDRIAITHDAESNRVLDPTIETMIDREWARQQDIARQRGATLYDASVYRLNNLTAEDDRLTLHLASVPYRVHATLKVLHTDSLIQEAHFDKVLIADAMIRTRDNFYLFGKIRKLIETTTYLIGGSCTPERQVISDAGDLWNYMRVKVDLILRTGAEKIAVGPLLGFIQNEVGCIHAIFDVAVDATCEEILQRFEPGNGVAGIESVPAAELTTFLQAGEGYVPSVAALLTTQTHPADMPMNLHQTGVQ